MNVVCEDVIEAFSGICNNSCPGMHFNLDIDTERAVLMTKLHNAVGFLTNRNT